MTSVHVSGRVQDAPKSVAKVAQMRAQYTSLDSYAMGDVLSEVQTTASEVSTVHSYIIRYHKIIMTGQWPEFCTNLERN
jgi:hypothetical protein